MAINKIRKMVMGYKNENYYYCISAAADLAATLGLAKISVIEFGVAGGNGLLEIERICRRIRKKRGMDFEIFGFDTGCGLPDPLDYRDLPYRWQSGFFDTDLEKLKQRIQVAQLIIGNVSDTLESFFSEYVPAPIGCVLFDLDYYSSTKAALKIFDGERKELYLPRIQCYFDDLGTVESVGERLAIKEFNLENDKRKIENSLDVLYDASSYLAGWRIFEYHDFEHPDYARPLKADDQLPLR